MTAPGLPIGAVVARSAVEAQLAAKAVKVEYEEHDPIITIHVSASEFLACFAILFFMCIICVPYDDRL